MKKRLLVLALCLVCLGLIAGSASATCTGQGQVVESYTSGTTTYYVIGGFADYWYMVSVPATNVTLLGQMNAACARNGNYVVTTSSASTCNQSTTVINNWGALTKVTLLPLY